MAEFSNTVDPDEMTQNELFHQALRCLPTVYSECFLHFVVCFFGALEVKVSDWKLSKIKLADSEHKLPWLSVQLLDYYLTLKTYEPRPEKKDFCICENKAADQLCGNRTTDQQLCFRYMDSTIPLLPKSEISSL